LSVDFTFSNLQFSNDLSNDVLLKSIDESKIKPKPFTSSKIIINLQQRTGNKTLTLIQGLCSDLDLNKILKNLKKYLSTGGTLLNTDNDKQVIQLQGDKRKDVYQYLISNNICSKTELIVI
jgi:translation initiation factor SUI1